MLFFPLMSALVHSRLKIERARQHINELSAILAAFAQSDFYGLRTEVDPKNGNTLLKFEIIEPLPRVSALIIGDTVHNLRSALDLMVCELVRANGRDPTDYTRFPFDRSRDQLVARISGGELSKLLPPEAFHLIIENVRPYNGGNDFLCALNKLDILDKHVLLLPTMQISSLSGVDVEGQMFTCTNATLVVQAGRVLIPISAPGEMHIKNRGKPAIAVLFGEGLPLEGKPVLPTLTQFTELVRGILDTFEACCFVKNP